MCTTPFGPNEMLAPPAIIDLRVALPLFAIGSQKSLEVVWIAQSIGVRAETGEAPSARSEARNAGGPQEFPYDAVQSKVLQQKKPRWIAGLRRVGKDKCEVD
ncbi:hypothetical protein CO660_01615 [Rhizobium sp. L9]|nr:hypothetical protein CO660_01615 [Rhizobium sp. L9]